MQVDTDLESLNLKFSCLIRESPRKSVPPFKYTQVKFSIFLFFLFLICDIYYFFYVQKSLQFLCTYLILVYEFEKNCPQHLLSKEKNILNLFKECQNITGFLIYLMSSPNSTLDVAMLRVEKKKQEKMQVCFKCRLHTVKKFFEKSDKYFLKSSDTFSQIASKII